jgi:YVTN family beta-propeller protein
MAPKLPSPSLPLAAVLLLSWVLTAQPARPAHGERLYTVAVPGNPFGAVESPDSRYIYIALTKSDGAGGIAVIETSRAGFELLETTSLTFGAAGLALTTDGRTLVATAGSVIYLVAVDGPTLTVTATLTDGLNAGSNWVSITPDDRYAFVCDESAGQITVIDLARMLALGKLSVGPAPTDIVFSPDGATAYLTIEVAPGRLGWPKACIQEGQTADQTFVDPEGAVIVFRVADAVANLAAAVNSPAQFIPAGCTPVRMALSPDGATLYVTDRNANAVLALAPATKTKIAIAPVGVAPVPIATFNHGTMLAVGNSNRFFQPDTPQTLTILNAGLTPIRTIPAGIFPRTLLLLNDERTMLLANYGSGTVQFIDTESLAIRR